VGRAPHPALAAIAYANPHSFAEWTKFTGEPWRGRKQPRFACCSAPPLRWCSRWWPKSASRSTSCAFCHATSAPRKGHGGSRCSAARPRLDRARRAQAACRMFLAFFCLEAWVSAEHAAEPASMYLEAFRYVLSQPDLAAGFDRHLRDPVAAQDQRDQRLCRIDRLVELLFTPDP